MGDSNIVPKRQNFAMNLDGILNQDSGLHLISNCLKYFLNNKLYWQCAVVPLSTKENARIQTVNVKTAAQRQRGVYKNKTETYKLFC